MSLGLEIGGSAVNYDVKLSGMFQSAPEVQPPNAVLLQELELLRVGSFDNLIIHFARDCGLYFHNSHSVLGLAKIDGDVDLLSVAVPLVPPHAPSHGPQ